jgi:hypothetical protein
MTSTLPGGLDAQPAVTAVTDPPERARDPIAQARWEQI